MDNSDLQISAQVEKTVELVFCNPKVDPDRITSLLGVNPTASLKEGETGHYLWNSESYVATCGEWVLSIRKCEASQSLEEFLVIWASWLENHKSAIRELLEDGYEPYLQINGKAVEENLSIFIDSSLLKRFAELGVAICVDAGTTNQKI
ncbi:hypothetical protein BH10CYA1_BH10CYA1_61890 [soil metagenome]